MEFIFLTGGILLGTAVTKLVDRRHKTIGVIEVDHRNNLCKCRITSNELDNNRIKKVVFNVKHNVDLSREEQIL